MGVKSQSLTRNKYSASVIFTVLFLVQCNKAVDLVSESVTTTSVPYVESVEVNKCPAAYRYKNFHSKYIEVPDNLVSNGESIRLRFGLKYQGCSDGETIVYPLPIYDENNTVITTPSNLHGSLPNQFLPDGKLRFQSRYYYKEDFCVLLSNETHINLEICKRKCNESKFRPCIPKCCDLDEVLEYKNNTFKCASSGNQQWKPFIYENPYQRLIHRENMYTEKLKPQFEKVELKDDWFEKWPATDLTHFKKSWARTPWRLLRSGQIVFLDQSRTWLPFRPGQLCINGIQNAHNEGLYNGEESNQIILFIPDSLPNSQDQMSQLYGIISYVSSVFYFAIVVVYLVLAKNQNVHGWTILCYVLSLFLMSILTGTTHYFTYVNNTDTYSASIIEMGTPQATLLAVFAHLFTLCAYTWIGVMSFDLLITFKSVTPWSSRSKGVKRFIAYSAIGWGLPITIVSISLTMDYMYSDPESEVITPDYGKHNYSIAPWAQGIYLYYIIAAILTVNLMCVLMTAASIWKFRRNTSLLSKGDLSTKNSDYLSFKLYAKLFIVMGVLWSFELVSWLHSKNDNPWYWVVVDVIACLQSAALFIIFICNKRTISQLQESVIGIQKSLQGSMQKLSFRRSSSQETDISRVSY